MESGSMFLLIDIVIAAYGAYLIYAAFNLKKNGEIGGAVWSKDIAKAIKVARSIETGRMWVNTYNQIPAGAPFGGYKTSGIGRETHKMILNAYTQVKNVMVNTNDGPSGFYPHK